LDGALPDLRKLRFGGHHGILPEPELARKCGTRARAEADSSLRSS
jgi:hypothetical protein